MPIEWQCGMFLRTFLIASILSGLCDLFSRWKSCFVEHEGGSNAASWTGFCRYQKGEVGGLSVRRTRRTVYRHFRSLTTCVQATRRQPRPTNQITPTHRTDDAQATLFYLCTSLIQMTDAPKEKGQAEKEQMHEPLVHTPQIRSGPPKSTQWNKRNDGLSRVQEHKPHLSWYCGLLPLQRRTEVRICG